MSTLPDRILDAALPAIAFDGWTLGVLEQAATSIGLTPFDVKRAFPNGVVEAVDHFTRRTTEEMLAALAKKDLGAMKIRERIFTAVMTRFQVMQPHREAVRRALAVYAMPWNAGHSMQATYAIVDAMWRAAGDTSTDYNFYTKRLTLAKVYGTSVSVWLADNSPDMLETQEFLSRRIENVMQFEKFKAKAKSALGGLEQWMPVSLRR